MFRSTYGPECIAANSFKTTSEYAQFIKAWINDELNYAFIPISSADLMKNDFLPNPKSLDRLVDNIDINDEIRDKDRL